MKTILIALGFLVNFNLVASPNELTNEEIIKLIKENAGTGGLQGTDIPDKLSQIGEPIFDLLSDYLLECNNSFEEGLIVTVFLKSQGNKEKPIAAVAEIQQRYEKGGEVQINNWLKKRIIELKQQQEEYLKTQLSPTPTPTPKPTLRPSPVSKPTPKPLQTEPTALLPAPNSPANYVLWLIALLLSALALTWLLRRAKRS